MQDFLNTYKIGAKHTWNDFTSCGGSKSASFANREGVNVIFQIKQTTGKDISNLADGIRYGTMPKPEILIKSGSKFKVLGTPSIDPESGKYLINVIQIE